MSIKILEVSVRRFGELEVGDKFILATSGSLSLSERSPEHLPIIAKKIDPNDDPGRDVNWHPAFPLTMSGASGGREQLAGGMLGPDTLVIPVR